MKINRLLTNLCSDDLPKTRDFYVTLFDFSVPFESDWFVSLVSSDQGLALGIIDRTHELVPADYQTTPQGFYLTIIVEDVDQAYTLAQDAGFPIISPPPIPSTDSVVCYLLTLTECWLTCLRRSQTLTSEGIVLRPLYLPKRVKCHGGEAQKEHQVKEQ